MSDWPTRKGTESDGAMDVLASISGRKTIVEIRDLLKIHGFINDMRKEARELVIARQLIRRYRKRCVERDDPSADLVNLIAIDAEGNKDQYYKPLRELSDAEAALLLAKQHDRIAVEQEIFQRYYKPLKKRFGSKKLQKLLPFDLSECSATPSTASSL